jgi:DNA-binding IclR family transcriptional regulator
MATVGKALSLLEHFSAVRAEIGLSDFARLSGFDKATAHRLLSELARHGMVQQDPASRVYRLGPAVARLAALREATQPRDQLARPHVEALSAEVGETAHLSLLAGEALDTALVVQGRAHTTQVVLELGEVLPLHATASGIAVLAALPARRRARLLRDTLKRFTAQTETDAARVDEMVRAALEDGIAESVGGYEEDVHGIGMALLDAHGEVAGAIAVATPATRMSAAHRARIRAALPEAAAAITETWGGSLPRQPKLEPAR